MAFETKKLTRDNIELFEAVLTQYDIHDSVILDQSFDRERRILNVNTENRYHRSKMDFEFSGVKMVLFDFANYYISELEINTVVASKDVSAFLSMSSFHNGIENCIDVCFELFEGYLLHIIAENVILTWWIDTESISG